MSVVVTSVSCIHSAGVFLINIARGPLLDYAAVVDGLDRGVIAGLGMDVFWTEPFDPEDPLVLRDNVICTPHVGGHTTLSHQKFADIMAKNILRVRDGQKPVDPVNSV